MIVEASQSFTLLRAGSPEGALAFVRTPAQALARLRFLRALQADAQGVRGELLVPVPVLGDVDLPFFSLLGVTPDGAVLTPQPLEGERAWVEVQGQATVRSHHSLEGQPGGPAAAGQSTVQVDSAPSDSAASDSAQVDSAELHFTFQFRAHLSTPEALGWGGAAFEKMVRAAATRTLERVAQDLPASIQAALDEAGSRDEGRND